MIEAARVEEAEFQKAVYDAAIAYIQGLQIDTRFGIDPSAINSAEPPPWENPPWRPRARLEYSRPGMPPLGLQYEMTVRDVRFWAWRKKDPYTKRDARIVNGMVAMVAQDMVEGFIRTLLREDEPTQPD